jgi:GTPase SAR1 family protein
LKQVKVLVLGKENVGKTTLVRRIIGDWGLGSRMKSFTFGKDTRNPTDGIDMKQWIPEEMENTIVYFWDFAGQELYYSTHHFFLTDNSINLIVFDCTKSLLENRLLFWLNSIQSRFPGSHIILVGSFTENMKKEKIEQISEEVSKLVNIWQSSIPSNQRPIFYGSEQNGRDISFWPLSCVKSSSKKIQSLYLRYQIIEILI